MKQVPDRKRPNWKRLSRAYLNKRWGIALRVQLLVFLVATFLYLIWGARHKGVVIEVLPIFILGAVGILVLAHETHQNYKTVRETYFPRVTPDTLPAEEILVRASEKTPVAQSEVLLRAAQWGQETPKKELLRVAKE
jgi:hypothetical protein